MFENKPLQTGVDYMLSARAGAYVSNKPHAIDSFDFGANFTEGATVRMGGAVELDTDKGVKLPSTSTTAILGFVVYENNSVIDYKGYKQGGLYANIPVITFGRVYVPIKTGEVIKRGDSVSLYVAAGDDFNTVEKTPVSPGSNDIDIHTQVTVAEDSKDGYVLLTLSKIQL